MTCEEAIQKLQEAQTPEKREDNCGNYMMADEVLCDLLTSLGYADVVAEWDKIGKWYA